MKDKYVAINHHIGVLIHNSKKVNILKKILQEFDEFEIKIAAVLEINISRINMTHIRNTLLNKKNDHMSNIYNAAKNLIILFDISLDNFDLTTFVLGTKDLLNGYAEIEDFKGNLWVLSLNVGEFVKEKLIEDEESREELPNYMKEPCSVLSDDDEYFKYIKLNNH